MEKQTLTKEEMPAGERGKPCHHPYLKTEKRTANKVCTSCGRVIYSGENKLHSKIAYEEKAE